MSPDAGVCVRAAGWLASVQRPDGSWGYRSDGEGYVEPTALAALAFCRTLDDRGLRDGTARAANWLLTNQHPDGSWSTTPATDPQSWATGYAVLALAKLAIALKSQEFVNAARQGFGALLATPTLYVPEIEIAVSRATMGVDARIAGWAWRPNDASWVFPTSIAIIAACSLGATDHPRVRQGVAYLLDRACSSGGWNIGSPLNFGEPVDPNPIDTSVALLALQAAGTEGMLAAKPAVDVLAELASRSATPLSLAWSALALRALGHSADDTLARLARQQSPAGDWRGNVVTASLVILASQPAPVGL